jgi:hypothetical protein
VAIIGAGPAGLMAAEACALAGARVTVYDAMPSAGRKFLLAGKGGLNLTHSEPLDAFYRRYAGSTEPLRPLLDAFGPAALRAWAQQLGVDTFVGTSGRVFPREMKAAPLLRAWLQRLRRAGVTFRSRHRWIGWAPPMPGTGSPIRLRLAANGPTARAAAASQPEIPAQAIRSLSRAELVVTADAVVLALGGGSWPRLGSDGDWVPVLAAQGVAIAPLAPANCGFDCGWSDHFGSRFAGAPVKSVAIALAAADSGGGSGSHFRCGEFVITATGVEGSLIYATAAAARDRIATMGAAILHLDLLPDRSEEWILQALRRPRGTRSTANHLRRCLRIDGVKAGLLRECLLPAEHADERRLAGAVKRLPLRLLSPRPLPEAISSAGGVRFESLDGRLMLRALPGVFCGGEMLDWEAPTGGYLLTACFATGRAAGAGAMAWLSQGRTPT